MTPEVIAGLPYRRNVGVMLVNAAGLVFVGQRIDSESPAWQMPQGGIDASESARDAALRELQEETGVSSALVRIEAETQGWISYELPPELIPRLWHGKYRGQKQKWFLMRFQGTDEQVRIDADDHQEFSRWRWLAPGDLTANIVPFKRDAYARVLKEFAPYLETGS